jgi:sulfur carrier protein ThiS
VAGTVTAALLLARLTLKPPLPAAAVSVTVQLSLPDPVIDALLQESALNRERVAYMVNYDALKKRCFSTVQLTGQTASARC